MLIIFFNILSASIIQYSFSLQSIFKLFKSVIVEFVSLFSIFLKLGSSQYLIVSPKFNDKLFLKARSNVFLV